MTRLIGAWALFAGFAIMGEAMAGERPLKVFICAGQSNMVGRAGVASKLPAELRGEQKAALFFNGKGWVPVAPGRTETRGFGPEISFALAMSKALGEPVGIIKHSVGGTDLAVKWNPKNSNSLYAGLARKVTAAGRTRKIAVVGMLWMQGERDSRFKDKAGAYADNFAGLIRAARKDFGNPAMLFVAGRVNPPPATYTFVGAVRKAQEQCKEPGYAYIDCDSLEKGSDNLHYTTKGLVDMGNAFAKAIIELARKTQGAPRRR